MKKFLKTISLFSLSLLMCVGLVGCGENSNSSIAYSIEYNTNKLSEILNKTTEAKNEDIIIPELYSLDEASALTNSIDNQTTKTLSQKTERVPKLDKQIVSNEEVEKEKTEIYRQEPVFSAEYPAVPTRSGRMTSSYYVPRRISNVNYSNTNFNSYVGKIEDLYLMMNDAVCANNDACDCKGQILEYCDILNALAKQIKSGEIELSEDQKTSCNNLLKELANCTSKITDTRNDVSNSCKSLGTKRSISSGVDTLSSKYVTLINCLDNRISNYQNALAILKQLQCAITNSCYTDNTADINLEDVLDNLIKNNGNDCENCLYDKNGNKCYLDENGRCYQIDENGEKCYICNNETNTCESNTLTESTQASDKEAVETKSTIQADDKTKIETKKIADYEKPEIQENIEKKKGNIDTFAEKTVKPNIIKKENTKQNKETKSENIKNNSTDQTNISQTANQQNANVNGINTPNNTNTYGIGNGTYNTPATNGINAPIQNGIGGAGVGIGGGIGNGYGNGIYGNGIGVHNFENGITNPYRNTDTYKFPPKALGGTYTGYGAVADVTPAQAELAKPLPSETRQDFKTFTKIEPNEITEETSNEKKDTKINTKTLSKYDKINTNPITEENKKTA